MMHICHFGCFILVSCTAWPMRLSKSFGGMSLCTQLHWLTHMCPGVCQWGIRWNLQSKQCICHHELLSYMSEKTLSRVDAAMSFLLPGEMTLWYGCLNIVLYLYSFCVVPSLWPLGLVIYLNCTCMHIFLVLQGMCISSRSSLPT